MDQAKDNRTGPMTHGVRTTPWMPLDGARKEPKVTVERAKVPKGLVGPVDRLDTDRHNARVAQVKVVKEVRAKVRVKEVKVKVVSSTR